MPDNSFSLDRLVVVAAVGMQSVLLSHVTLECGCGLLASVLRIAALSPVVCSATRMVFSSDSEDSEDSLLSLDEIQPWRRSQGKCSPLKSDRKGSHATATQDRRHSNRKHKSRSDSKVTVETFVRQQHGSSIANGQSKRGHDKQRSENATQRRSEEPHPDDRNPVAASAEGRSSQPQASTLSGPVTPYEMDTVPDSETEEDQDLEKHFDRLQIQAPPLHSSIFSQERSAPLSVEPSYRQEARSLADLLFPFVVGHACS